MGLQARPHVRPDDRQTPPHHRRPHLGTAYRCAYRHTRLDELRTVVSGRTDLLIQEAGIILGVRVDNEHGARYIGDTAGTEMLLELVGVAASDERVQR